MSLPTPYGSAHSAHGASSPLSRILAVSVVGTASPVSVEQVARLRDCPLFLPAHFRSRPVALGGQYDLEFDPTPFPAPSGTTQSGESVRVLWFVVDLNNRALTDYAGELSARFVLVSVPHSVSLTALLPGDPRPRQGLVQVAALALTTHPVRVTVNARLLGAWAQLVPVVG